MNPTPDQIKNARVRAGISQSKAASLLDVSIHIYQAWEQGLQPMPPASWETFERETARAKVKSKDNDIGL